MKKNNIYFAAAAALLALAGCNKEIITLEPGGITVDASIGAMTKVSYDGTSTSFTAGDQIAVYAWTGGAGAVPDTRVVDGVRNTLGADGKWTPATQMRWKSGADPHYFLGIYPVKDIADFTADAYTLDPAAYTASDLLIATNFGPGDAGLKAADGTVSLGFDHAMAKLNVNLKFRGEFGGTPTVSGVTATAKNTATVNYLTKAVTATGDASAVGIPAAPTAATGYALSFSGLQVPQSGVTTVTVSIGGNEYVYTSATDIPLESGKYTTLGLVVGKDKVELASVTVSDWTAGTDLPGGEAVPFALNGHRVVDMGTVVIGGVEKNLKWAACNMGADNPWDYGDYYSWGATATQTSYDWAHYPFMQAGQSDWLYITKYTVADGQTDGTFWYNSDGFFLGDGKTSFADYDYADDAARQLWGGNWRIPTDEEWTALRNTDLYDWVWTTDYLGSGENGMLVTRKDGTGPCAGNSIFLPAAGNRLYLTLINPGLGYYWSSSLDTYSSSSAWFVYFNSGGVDWDSDGRYIGLSVRPVAE